MHVADQHLRMIGAMGIVAAGLPIAAGAAFAGHYRGTDEVAVAFFGDGAVHQGSFHEALGFASLFRCPVLFVCENNLYAETTATDYHLLAGSVVAMAAPYRIASARVDGMDVVAVRRAAREALEVVRATKRPFLLEATDLPLLRPVRRRRPGLQAARGAAFLPSSRSAADFPTTPRAGTPRRADGARGDSEESRRRGGGGLCRSRTSTVAGHGDSS